MRLQVCVHLSFWCSCVRFSKLPEPCSGPFDASHACSLRVFCRNACCSTEATTSRANTISSGLNLFDRLAKTSLDSFTKAGGIKHSFKLADSLSAESDVKTACTVLSLLDHVSKSQVTLLPPFIPKRWPCIGGARPPMLGTLCCCVHAHLWVCYPLKCVFVLFLFGCVYVHAVRRDVAAPCRREARC